MKSKILFFLNEGSSRTIMAKKNIIISFILKGISILISLQVVPITIHYVNSTRYGIWLTLSSLVSWLSFFDIGLTHGFRNRFAESKALGNIEQARVYVSTTYAVLFILFIAFSCLMILLNTFLNWSDLLNINQMYSKELNHVFLIVAVFFGINIVASVFTTMLVADQRPAVASFIQVIGQSLSFAIVYILTKLTTGSLLNLALVFSGIPVLVIILSSVILYKTKYKTYAPQLKLVKFSFVKSILGLGGQFFVITTSMLLIFQLMNVIISRVEGPEVVTQYNLAYRYFNALLMVVVIVLNPFWSAFTDAYAKKDYVWMRRTKERLELLWIFSIPIIGMMVWASNLFYGFWLGHLVEIPLETTVAVSVYVLFQILGNIYMYMINGTGKVRIQLIVYACFAIVAYPVMSCMCDRWGITGLLVLPTVVYILQGIIGRIQLRRLIDNRAVGVWNK